MIYFIMAKVNEKVLLFNFQDEATIEQLRVICREMNLSIQMVPKDAWNQKVGYLLGKRGFVEAKADEDVQFVLSDEVLIFSHLTNKRLDQFLKKMKDNAVPPIIYKAVVTSFNTLWTLRRLCETMQTEHGAVAEWKKTNGK